MNYILFVSFFPQLFAGPIVYHREMASQFRNKKIFNFDFDVFTPGLILFFLGLFKKVVLADNLAVLVSPVYDNFHDQLSKPDTINFVSSWKASLAYTFQLYFDFSGYSDMAIGISNMFGIRLPLNFNSLLNFQCWGTRHYLFLFSILRNARLLRCSE